MKIAILGFSSLEQSESLPIYRYFKQKNDEITVFYWGDPDIPSDVKTIKINEGAIPPGLDEFDLIVRGPAVHLRQIQTSKPVTSLTNIFVEQCPSRNIIGVTGTKGKGTTSTLIAKILEAANYKVWLGGNIGRPLLDNLGDIKPNDWVVLEMSAGQLINFNQNIPIAVCLMVVPEHLNWHTDLDEYIFSKKQLFIHQRPEDLAIYNANNAHSKEVVSVSPASKLAYDVPLPGAEPQNREAAYVLGGTIYMKQTPICKVDQIALRGRHNLENVCAAITATWEVVNHNVQAITQVITSFSGLEHRLELVRELDRVSYYDDSFGTAPETAIVALQAFNEPKVIILGGSDKGARYDELAQTVVQSNVRAVITIGDTGPAIASALQAAGYEHIQGGGNTMQEIVNQARQLAQPRDVVLLSTACASFGMFENYKDRGDQFKQAVQALA